jgi:peroxin-6
MVTNVECEPRANGSRQIKPSDLSVAFAVGELGCWVDATETRMVQTGVEHALIPDTFTYMGTSFLTTHEHSHIRAVE